MSEDRPAWWRCTESADPRFTEGTAYEVLEYDYQDRAVIVTNRRALATLPVEKANFEPHYPWPGYQNEPRHDR